MNPVEHAIYTLRNAPLRRYPFPHFYAENVFPADFYTKLRAELPEDARYKTLSGYPSRLITDGPDAACLEPFKSDYFLYSVAALFGVPQHVSLEGELRLVRDREGYEITPHTDGPWKVISLLFYLPPDDSQREHGTSIYVPKDRKLRCPGGPHWPREPFDLAWTAPYLPNACFGFLKTDNAWHGVEKIDGPIRRDVLLYNVYNKTMRDNARASAGA